MKTNKLQVLIIIFIVLLLSLSTLATSKGQADATGQSTASKGTTQAQDTKATILFIGDSHSVGTFGTTLESLLNQNNKVIRKAIEGTGITAWINGQHSDQSFDSFSKLIQDSSPNTVIIALGTNLFGSDQSTISSKANQLIQTIPQSTKCIWVGPPQVSDSHQRVKQSDINKVHQALQESATSKCTLIDSRTLAPGTKTGSGGLHFSGQAAKDWAQGVFNQINNNQQEQKSQQKQESQDKPQSTSKQDSDKILVKLFDIDLAWTKFANLIGIPNANKYWIPSKGWVDKNKITQETILTKALYDVKRTTKKEELNVEEEKTFDKLEQKEELNNQPVNQISQTTDIDTLFNKYGQEKGIPPALIKAISHYETGGTFNSNLIGPSGDLGVGQFTIKTAKDYESIFGKLTNCCKLDDDESHSCIKERKQVTKMFKPSSSPNPYACNPQNDGRFDPDKSINAMSSLLQRRYNYFNNKAATKDDQIKLTIASYHLGAGGVNKFIKKTQKTTVTWDETAKQMTQDYKRGKTKEAIMRNYVNHIYKNYQKFNQ
jgi:hypothetical protein